MMMDSPDLLQANNSHSNNLGHHTTSSRSFFDFDDIMMEVLDLNSSSVPLSPPTIMIPNNNNQTITPSNNNNHSIIESLGLCFDTMADEGSDSAADHSNTCLAGSTLHRVSPIVVDHHTKQQQCDHQARTQHLKPSSPVTPRLSLDPVSVMRDWEEAIFKATSSGTPIVNVSNPPHLHHVNTFQCVNNNNNNTATNTGNGSTKGTLDESAACSLIHQYLTNNMNNNNNNNTTQDYLGGVLARCTNMQPTMKLGTRSPSMMCSNNNGHSRGICKKQRSQANCFQSLQNYTSQQGIVMNNHHQQQALMNNYSSGMNSPSVSSTCSPSATVAMSPANVSTNSFGGQQQMIMNGVGGQHYYSPTSGTINNNGYNQVVFSNQSVNNSLAMNQRKGKVPNGRQPQDKKGVKGQGLLVDINPNDRRVKMTQETVDEKFKLHIEDGINTKKKKQNSLQFHTCKFVPSQ